MPTTIAGGRLPTVTAPVTRDYFGPFFSVAGFRGRELLICSLHPPVRALIGGHDHAIGEHYVASVIESLAREHSVFGYKLPDSTIRNAVLLGELCRAVHLHNDLQSMPTTRRSMLRGNAMSSDKVAVVRVAPTEEGKPGPWWLAVRDAPVLVLQAERLVHHRGYLCPRAPDHVRAGRCGSRCPGTMPCIRPRPASPTPP